MKNIFSGRESVWFILGINILLSSCAIHAKDTTNVIVGYTNCNDSEISNDIIYSMEQISEFTKMNDIKLIVKNTSEKCGYKMQGVATSRTFFGAMTDYDLMLEVRAFFSVK